MTGDWRCVAAGFVLCFKVISNSRICVHKGDSHSRVEKSQQETLRVRAQFGLESRLGDSTRSEATRYGSPLQLLLPPRPKRGR